MPKFLVVRQLSMSGDVDQIIIDECTNESEAWKKHSEFGLVSIVVAIDEVKLPYKVYKKIGD